MSRHQPSRRNQFDLAGGPRYDDIDDETLDDDSADGSGSLKLRPSNSNVTEDLEPFMGVKVRRKASRHRDYVGDYLDVQSRPYLMKILEKQGGGDRLIIEIGSFGLFSFDILYIDEKEQKVLFVDKVLKITGSGKMKRRTLLITDFAIYIVDPDTDALKRRIALAAVERLCLSELSDNFFAIIIPTEYDLLMASTRKTEIVTVLVDATKSASDYELEVSLSNR
ncbi:hypothetical protein DH2020_048573 [Rehmannia glutinosa]|uniref:TH1 domain-containing protein n=1 Tax=Rehmannia glutinosa TaxID=99300 RepID=A0ABR0U5Z8_REHGL